MPVCWHLVHLLFKFRPTLILPTSFKSYTLWNQQFAPENRPFGPKRHIWISEEPSIFRCYVGYIPSSHKLFWISLRLQEGYWLPITWRKRSQSFFPTFFWYQNHGGKRKPRGFFFFSETSVPLTFQQPFLPDTCLRKTYYYLSQVEVFTDLFHERIKH